MWVVRVARFRPWHSRPCDEGKSDNHGSMALQSRIRILDEGVANQIAAGEVVERPASVVKELAENAVDAGATRVRVDVAEGGKQLIRVADNGCGMSAQEAVLSLQRHATSKITRAEDLSAVRTLGFRGEALPSIASVARLTVLTRARGDLEGTRLEVEAGEIHTLEAAAAPEGTSITVADLFYNTPARLKFLKTNRTELGQICDVLSRLALSHPGVAVCLVSDGDEILNLPGTADPLNTVAELYGRDVARDLLPITWSREGLAVEGYTSRPSITRPTRSGQHTFVNGRWVRNRTLTHAIDEAYRSTMPPGRHPFAVLHVQIDPGLVDVNVHPAKSEVRFVREWEVHRAVFEAVRHALGQPGPAIPTEPLAIKQTLDPEALQRGAWLPPDPTDPFADEVRTPLRVQSAVSGAATQPTIPDLQAPLPALRPIAQLWNSYIVAEGALGLALIDQHLAHERILFDRFQAARAESPAPAQLLAPPATVTLQHRDAVALEEFLPELRRIGWDLEPFGKDAFVIRAAPSFIAGGSEVAVLRRLLDELVEHRSSGGREGARTGEPDRLVATSACKAAVKKGARLALDEIRQLLEDLGRSSNPHTCPHGCPIMVEITYQELLRRFKRI